MNHQMNGIALPNEDGFFGEYGGQFIPPHLKEAMDEINIAYRYFFLHLSIGWICFGCVLGKVQT